MTSRSRVTGLQCIDCGASYGLDYRLECAACHGLLELQYDEPALRAVGPAVLEGHGLWRYAPVLPIADPAHRVSLGEGGSPLLECPALGRALGVRRLQVKFEGSNPTGTVKDRSSPTAVGAALQFGFRATSVVSSGNAGSSIAAYSARAGLRSLIFAYERTSAPKLLHMAAAATDLVLYQGVYDDLITPWDRLVDERLYDIAPGLRDATGPLYAPAAPALRRVIVLGDAAPGTTAWKDLPETLEDAFLDALERTVSPVDLATIFFTSGTTAKAKAVAHNHAAVVTSARRSPGNSIDRT